MLPSWCGGNSDTSKAKILQFCELNHPEHMTSEGKKRHARKYEVQVLECLGGLLYRWTVF